MKTLEKTTGNLIRFLNIYQDILIGAAAILFSVIMFLASGKVAVNPQNPVPVDSAVFLPRVVFSLLIIIGLYLIFTGAKHIPANRESAPAGEALEKMAKGTLRSFGALLMLAVYAFCFNRLGFVLSSILYMVANMMYMTKKEKRRPLLFLVIAVVMTLLVYFCFRQFLYIYLPNGILKGVF